MCSPWTEKSETNCFNHWNGLLHGWNKLFQHVKQFYLTGEVLLNPVSAHSSCLRVSGLLGQNRRNVWMASRLMPLYMVYHSEYQCVIYAYVGMYRQNVNSEWMKSCSKHDVIEIHGTLMVILIFYMLFLWRTAIHFIKIWKASLKNNLPFCVYIRFYLYLCNMFGRNPS